MIHALEMIIDDTSLLSVYGLTIMTDKDDLEDGKGTTSTHVMRNGLYLGEKEKENKTLKVTVGKYSDGEFSYIDGFDRDRIDFFLTSKYGLQKIQFVQDDMPYYYMGKINNIVWRVMGNDVFLLEFEIETNSPYATKEDVVNTYNFTAPTNTITIYNQSHGDRWTKPTIKIIMDTASDISIKNVTDNGRTFTMTGLLAQEVIEIDSKSGRITSSTGLNKKANCNLMYPRFAYGNNTLQITGNIKSMEIRYKNEVR